MRQGCESQNTLKWVETALRRFESESGTALAPVFHLSLSKPLEDDSAEASSVRLEWMSQARHFKRAVRTMQPLLNALRKHGRIREIVLVECEEDFDGAACRGETWFLEFAG